ncbi:hypothetical protein Tco_0051911 [Tanacetum coccineum]
MLLLSQLHEEHLLDIREWDLNCYVQVPLLDIEERGRIPYKDTCITFLPHFVKIFTISDDVAKRAKNVIELNRRFPAIDDVNKGTLVALSIVRATSTRVWFCLSTTPFCSGVRAVDVWFQSLLEQSVSSLDLKK